MFAPLNEVAAARPRLMTPCSHTSVVFRPLWLAFEVLVVATVFGCGPHPPAIVEIDQKPWPRRLVALPPAMTTAADLAGQSYAASIHRTAALMLAAMGEPGPAELAAYHCCQRRLTVEQASDLRDNRMAVILTELRELDPDVAQILGTCRGILDFSVLESLDADAAAALAGRRDVLRLNALTQLDAATARELARSECGLQLKGLTRLEPGVAEALARHRGCLCLNSLETLSAEDACHLARHQGDLCLNGLSSLGDAAARALSSFRFGLHLNGLVTLSVPAATALARHPGWCLGCQGLEELSEDAAAALARHRRSGPTIVSRRILEVADAAADRHAAESRGNGISGLSFR